ncbi:hypothetical protein sscle_05g043900 [Sclerotinia sclerotiorum 1980 UF-70]|uniref:Uncharacterized protein n=1 Tax=Sclerotinia sclerotiorum (strain ATCC 18683 / 1980 / Ss-1) TaxID=665079 RepID=A0A1D9Q3T2_SCLS1|nr:hypothetical protein sscle_05g043900 [Sclerotinia sclerotiorum 1980 UF-70]
MRKGANFHTTTSSRLKRDYLIKEVGLLAANIVNSRDASYKRLWVPKKSYSPA